VETGISEFSFAYGFLYEQTRANWKSLLAAPILPSLVDEKTKGWDANLPTVGADFYYQFKLSEHVRGPNANCRRDGHFSSPFFRFWLHQRDRNNQHRALRKLAETKPDTFYVAPQFTTREAFNDAFLSSGLFDSSRLIRLSDCKDHNDGEHHYLAFQPGEPGWVEHSEGTFHEQSHLGTDLEGLIGDAESRWRPITKEFAIQLVEDLQEAAARAREAHETEMLAQAERRALSRSGTPILDLSGPPGIVEPTDEQQPRTLQGPVPNFDDPSREQVLLYAANLASTIFGVTMVIAGRSG
jgi:hypothetical protein